MFWSPKKWKSAIRLDSLLIATLAPLELFTTSNLAWFWEEMVLLKALELMMGFVLAVMVLGVTRRYTKDENGRAHKPGQFIFAVI